MRRLPVSALGKLTKTNVISSAFADIGVGWVLRRQCGGLLTVAASSSWTAASRISELTLPTLCRHLGRRAGNGRFHKSDCHSLTRPGGPSVQLIVRPRQILRLVPAQPAKIISCERKGTVMHASDFVMPPSRSQSGADDEPHDAKFSAAC